jgi:hypothetical protein
MSRFFPPLYALHEIIHAFDGGIVMPDCQCQHCGQPLEIGHNCNGLPFESAPHQNSIPAIGARKEILHRKGFHQTSCSGDVYYDHPMYGRVCIYPGGAFRTVFVKTELPLDEYLESLNDSSYTVIEDQASYTARCNVCEQIGNPFPIDISPFPHKANCSQGKAVNETPSVK